MGSAYVTSARTDEHMKGDQYLRYHTDVHLPTRVREAATEVLPVPGSLLKPSLHYRELARERHLPEKVRMPREYTLVDVTLVASTLAVFRMMVRFRWTGRHVPASKQADLTLVVEPDGEIVTAYFISPNDTRSRIDRSVYEQEEEE